MKNILLALFIIILTPLSGLAVDWTAISESKTDDILYLDRDSVWRDGNTFFCRYKIVINNSQNYLKQQGVSYTLYEKTFNCKNKTHKIIRATNFDDKGNILYQSQGPLSDFEPIASGSFAESVFIYLCPDS